MRPDDVYAVLRKVPFRPFKLFVLEQTSFDAPHRDFLAVSRSVVTLTVQEGEEGREVVISLLHISRIEELV